MAPSQESIQPHPIAASELVRRWRADRGSKNGHVVLVHGIAEHSGRYEQVGEELSAAGYDVTGFDLIGHGATGGRRGHVDNWADYLDQVEDHLTAVQEEGVPVVLLGHSMGGLIATEYALSERPRPDLLVLSAPAVQAGARWQTLLAPILAIVTPRLAVPSRIKGEQLSRDPKVGEEYFADPLVVTSGTARLGDEIFSSVARVRTRLDDIGIPTLVIQGSDDTISHAATTGSVPGDRILYAGLRHEVFNEPEGAAVLADVIDWMDIRISELSHDN